MELRGITIRRKSRKKTAKKTDKNKDKDKTKIKKDKTKIIEMKTAHHIKWLSLSHGNRIKIE
ncbi:hypothetical protein [Paenibacillus barcinonensis]|uniref:hypothetical protein n=1 Tax=Paenibacillus barcinonensis TaxID=198119 RepID=UPI000DA1D5C8|nr:hypothetical protein [Paenibacillus barcinonensis]